MIGWIESRLRGSVPASIPYTDPLRAGRHPFQTYMLVLCVVSSVPLVAGRVTAGSIAEAFPQIGAFLWGLSLLMGALAALVGSFWRGRYETALFLERVGLDFAGFAALVYGILIPFFGGLDGLIAAAVVIGFGLSCLVRARDIASIFARAAERNSPRIEVEGE